MVKIPAGEFWMGSSPSEIDWVVRKWPDLKREWFTDEQPRHRVHVDSFFMDTHEVTNDQFERFKPGFRESRSAEYNVR